jgi:hypothetical protein
VTKLTRVTHKIATQLHLAAESCTICISHSRQPVRKLLDTPSYCENTTVGRSEKGRLQMCEQWQGMSVVQTRRADKENRNAGDRVVKYQARTATVRVAVLQTVREMQKV